MKELGKILVHYEVKVWAKLGLILTDPCCVGKDGLAASFLTIITFVLLSKIFVIPVSVIKICILIVGSFFPIGIEESPYQVIWVRAEGTQLWLDRVSFVLTQFVDTLNLQFNKVLPFLV